jgi:hypothetical protein
LSQLTRLCVQEAIKNEPFESRWSQYTEWRGTAQTRWQNKSETDSCHSLHWMDLILPKDATTTTRRAWRQAGSRASGSGRSCPPLPRANPFGGTGAGSGIARSMGASSASSEALAPHAQGAAAARRRCRLRSVCVLGPAWLARSDCGAAADAGAAGAAAAFAAAGPQTRVS